MDRAKNESVLTSNMKNDREINYGKVKKSMLELY